MPAIYAAAPAKIILFGEHAVVYGQPALAVPLPGLKARAAISPEPRQPSGYIRLLSPQVDLDSPLADLPPDHPLRQAVESTLRAVGLTRLPACTIRISSTIPVASGLGSGAAVTTALVRAVSAFAGRPLDDAQVSGLVFEVEKIYHGSPSGIDNTVIAYNQPVFFVRGHPIQTFRPLRPFTLVVGDTGQPASTAESVGDVRQAWQADPARYEPIFEAIGQIAREARQAIESGDIPALGPLMDRNQALLTEIGVSSPMLDQLIAAARLAGAGGAKLSGGGRGGNMIALASPETARTVSAALSAAGAARALVTEVGAGTA